jgi:hypothetical protein
MITIKRGLQILFNFLNTPQYEIRRGYIHAKNVPHFDDMKNEDEWQKEVYIEVSDFMIENNLKTVCDFGCGSAYKLIKYFNEFESVGVEIEPTLQKLKDKYPNERWFSFEEIIGMSFDVIILADVIEHVPFPDQFLDKISQDIYFKYIFISTPDRSIKGSRFGPPWNKHHYREWTKEEFYKFIQKKLSILYQVISNKEQATQLLRCKGNITNN